MTDEESFDQWVVQEGGPEAVVEMVSRLRHQIDDGTLPGFTDRHVFLEHLRRIDRRSA
jgi:hypothetical protein